MLVTLSVVEQRVDAVRAVLSGAKVTAVATAIGVSRQSVHSRITRYLAEGLPGLADQSHRPNACPHQVCGQKIALGRTHAGQTLTIAVSDTTLAIELDDQETRIVRRTTTTPARNIKADRPWTVPHVS